MKKLIVLFLMGIALLSCQNEEDASLELTCGVLNPVAELDWLEEKTEELEREQTAGVLFSEYFYIAQTEHNGDTLFIYGNCCPNCNSVAPVYNCSGQMLGILGGEDGEFSFDLLKDSQIIWKAENNSCQFGNS